MKIKFQALGVSFIIILLLSCKRESPNINVVFLSSAETAISTSITVDSTGGEMALMAKSSQITSTPITAFLETDTTLISTYNILTGKHFSPLPPGSYELTGNSVTIHSGTNISDVVKLKILSTKNFKDGASYVVPVTIKSASHLPVLEASRTIFVVVNRVIVSTVASLAGNYYKVDFSKNNDNLKSMSNISYEVRVMANQFQSSSPFISSIMGIEENFLFRFGDVTVLPNQLQLAGGLTATNVPTQFSAGIWYHLAAVYDGAQLKIYINGQLAATKTASRTVDLTSTYSGGFHFGYSAGGRLFNGAISEARIWSRALTQSEIINGMCVIDPASPGLVGYWKFNEGAGDIVYDISGNGRNATANKTVTWIPNIRCN
ncbi:MAG: DUF1735 domain-containing protein [Sphingobacteriales bacterium]|jgi:hypothetical protein|nr:DUF1735 domain-containing protein [Sphingobacteriales bacterium]